MHITIFFSVWLSSYCFFRGLHFRTFQGIQKMKLCKWIFLFTAIICTCARLSTANSAMAIDLGAEFMKLALIKPGVPMETVLNRDSQRKTPMALAIKDGERFLGDAALKKALVRSKNTFTFFLDLVGKQMEGDDPSVTTFRAEFPYLTLKAHPKRGTVQFETDVGDMSMECALGMLLWNARHEVEAYAGQLVRDAIVTVPSYFGQAERAAIEAAAKIADINLLQLLGSGTAAGLNYGVFRLKEITEQPKTLLIYDVGSTKTLVTIVQFRLVNDTNGNGSNNYPQVETIGVGYDRALGGHHLTLRLRDHLVNEFKKKNPSLGTDITANPQAMAKLLKEADRVKQVLSANAQCFAQVESVFEDRDFRVPVTREELETMFHDFEQRHLDPINVALSMAQLSLDQLDRVVLMGAGTRVPRLQTLLATFFQGKELGRMLNTDEAIALGAVYQAARLSKRFVIKRFEVKDLLSTENIDEELLKKMTMDEEEIREAKRILNEFELKEKAKAEHALALNLLESAVYDYSAKLEEDTFNCFGTEKELGLIHEQVAKMKDWLEDMPDDTNVEELKQKRRELMAPIRKLKSRKRQKEDRPGLMDKLTKMLDDAEKKLEQFSTKACFKEGDLSSYQRTIEEVKAWLDRVKKELEQLKDNQDATFTTDDLKTKRGLIVVEERLLDAKCAAAIQKQIEEAAAEAKKKAEAENRKRQKEDRPELMEKMAKTLDEAEKKLEQFSTKACFKEGDLSSYQRTIDVAKAWFDGVKKELEQLEDNQDATFTTDDLKTKRNLLVAEMSVMDAKCLEEENAEEAKKESKAEEKEKDEAEQKNEEKQKEDEVERKEAEKTEL